MNLVKNSAEAMSIVRIVVGDICGPIHFEPLNKTESGRNKILRAEQFSVVQRFKASILRNTITDLIITGEGFNWLGKLDDAQIMAILKLFPDDVKGDYVDKVRKIRHIASTSVTTEHDMYNVTGYSQHTSVSAPKKFTTDEIIKLTFEELDGKVEGFTPLMSLPLHIELLWLMWQNQYMLQKRGNHPDLVVSAMGINDNHPSYNKLRKELMSYNTPGNPNHGTLLFSAGREGKIDVKQLEKADSLQFKEVGQFVSSMMAMMWQIPGSRLGVKTDQSASSKDSNSGADRAYWYTIRNMQDIIAEIYNSQLFIPFFGVKLVFDQSYMQDEVAEMNVKALQLSNIQTMLNLLQNKQKTLKENTLLKLMNGRYYEIDEGDLEEVSPEQLAMMQPVKQTGSLKEPESDSTQELAAEKRKEEVNREAGAGVPNGF